MYFPKRLEYLYPTAADTLTMKESSSFDDSQRWKLEAGNWAIISKSYCLFISEHFYANFALSKRRHPKKPTKEKKYNKKRRNIIEQNHPQKTQSKEAEAEWPHQTRPSTKKCYTNWSISCQLMLVLGVST